MSNMLSINPDIPSEEAQKPKRRYKRRKKITVKAHYRRTGLRSGSYIMISTLKLSVVETVKLISFLNKMEIPYRLKEANKNFVEDEA